MSATTSTRTSLSTFLLLSRHMPSCFLKSLPSSGIWRIMSSEPKMGSRYCHTPCTLSQMSIRSWMSTSLFDQLRARSSNGLIAGEPCIVCDLTMWSSSSACTSSEPDMMNVPVSRYSFIEYSSGCQSLSILSSAFSSENSLEALPATSSSTSWCLSSLSLSIWSSVVAALGEMF